MKPFQGGGCERGRAPFGSNPSQSGEATRVQHPKGFEPHRILDGNFGAYSGDEDHLIRLILRGADAIEATAFPWHKSLRHTLRGEGEARDEFARRSGQLNLPLG